MDPSLYKDVKTSRGLNYHYFASPAKDGKPTLVFLHGFPSNAYSWNEQIKFVVNLGYGVIAPDLLGFGGTDKPTDGALYRLKLMAQDVMDIVGHEGVEKVVVAGHDWGSVLLSRVANYHQNDSRIIGFAFFALSYYHPMPNWTTDSFVEHTANFHDEDHEIHGYFYFFAEEDAAKVIEEHAESFFSLLYTEDPKILQKNFCPTGALKKWLLANKTTKTAAWMTDEERKHHVDVTLAGGFTAPLCWYKQIMDKHTPEDDATIPKEDYLIHKPVLFVAGLKDVILPPAMSEASHKQYCPEGKIVEVDADHFLINSAPGECNVALLSWINELGY